MAWTLVNINQAQAMDDVHLSKHPTFATVELPGNLELPSCVNTCKLMWSKWPHSLELLIDRSGKKSFYWTPQMNEVFIIIKSILAADAPMTYPTMIFYFT